MTLPDKQLLRRGEVRLYLNVSRHALAQMIAAGVLNPVHLTGGAGRAYFARSEVLAVATASRVPPAPAQSTINSKPSTRK